MHAHAMSRDRSSESGHQACSRRRLFRFFLDAAVVIGAVTLFLLLTSLNVRILHSEDHRVQSKWGRGADKLCVLS